MAGSSESMSVLTTMPPAWGGATGSAENVQSVRAGRPTGRRARRIWWLVVAASVVMGISRCRARMLRRAAGGGDRERTKKKPRRTAASCCGRRRSDDADVRCLQALLALLDFEFDALVFLQRLESAALDVAEVGEEVGAARV